MASTHMTPEGRSIVALAASRFRLTPPTADAVTTSASGLDPHISPQFAAAQVPAVARARGLGVGRVRALVEANVE